jgi:hypothetical protein
MSDNKHNKNLSYLPNTIQFEAENKRPKAYNFARILNFITPLRTLLEMDGNGRMRLDWDIG